MHSLRIIAAVESFQRDFSTLQVLIDLLSQIQKDIELSNFFSASIVRISTFLVRDIKQLQLPCANRHSNLTLGDTSLVTQFYFLPHFLYISPAPNASLSIAHPNLPSSPFPSDNQPTHFLPPHNPLSYTRP